MLENSHKLEIDALKSNSEERFRVVQENYEKKVYFFNTTPARAQ